MAGKKNLNEVMSALATNSDAALYKAKTRRNSVEVYR